MVFFNTGQKYHGILTLEKGGTTENYRGVYNIGPRYLGFIAKSEKVHRQNVFGRKGMEPQFEISETKKFFLWK
jgi:hypothetical protein